MFFGILLGVFLNTSGNQRQIAREFGIGIIGDSKGIFGQALLHGGTTHGGVTLQYVVDPIAQFDEASSMSAVAKSAPAMSSVIAAVGGIPKVRRCRLNR